MKNQSVGAAWATETAGGAVAEIQGLYGPFSFPEKFLQRIWLHGDFDGGRLRTTDGAAVEVLEPGRWNLLGGPDFKGARLKIGGVAVSGDVEVHLRAQDWAAHRHAGDRAYDEVALHVVLFPPAAGHVTAGANGRRIPIVALLPLLHHDLEEYAADEAIERLADHPLARVHAELAALAPDALGAELRRGAEQRWRQKVHFAALRTGRLGWEAACHQTALEIFGYRFNRAPMLAVGTAYPLAVWRAEGEGMAERAYAACGGRWSLQGVRPANHPRARLRQYGRWVAAVPDWPERLERFVQNLPVLALGDGDGAAEVGAVRREHGFGALREAFAEQVCGGAVGGTRFDTLVCDGFLPLLAARHAGREWSGWWHAWFAGDRPERHTRILRELGVVRAPARPHCHGLFQGLLAWMLAHEPAEKTSAPAPAGRGA